MKESMWLARLLSIGAVLETPTGLGLLAFPSLLVSLLFGEPLTDTGLVVARLAGGGLLGLGVACWYARVTPITHAGIGVAIGFLVYNVVATVVLGMAQADSATNILLLGASALHGLLATGLAAALFARTRHRTPQTLR